MRLGQLASMTGFGRASASVGDGEVTCEMRSVNGRGLDIRTRLAPGLESVEADLRRNIGEAITRGTLQVSMTLHGASGSGEIVVNAAALDAVLAAIADISKRIRVRRPAPEAILALKGVIDTRDAALSPEQEEARSTAIAAIAGEALAALVAARREEGARIGALLLDRLDAISALVAAAEIHPARTREAILARLRSQIADLGETGATLSEDRLAQEALLLATKADIREELDRLAAHIAAARTLLAKGGAIGRKLDFLAQEFNREANTLCSKSNDVSLTAIGLDLKAVIDQLREQVQNLE